MSEFYDANLPLGGLVLEDESSIDVEEEIALCDSCENVILKPYIDGLSRFHLSLSLQFT